MANHDQALAHIGFICTNLLNPHKNLLQIYHHHPILNTGTLGSSGLKWTQELKWLACPDFHARKVCS